MSDFGTEELSARGVRAQARPFSYFDAFVKTFSDAYDRESNPDGYINLAVAQNNLTVDLLHDRFNDALKELSPSTTAQYDDMKGSHALRCAMARHMTRRVVADDSVEAVRAEDLVLSSGAGALIENLVFCVCNEGDGVFIPSPYYPAFPNDLRARLGVQTVPVSSTRSSASRGQVCLPQVGADYDQAARRRNIEERKDLHMKMILLSNPSNPQGIIYSREDMEETIVWAVSQKLHVISDEIYACMLYTECPKISAQVVTESARFGLKTPASTELWIMYLIFAQFLDQCSTLSRSCSMTTNFSTVSLRRIVRGCASNTPRWRRGSMPQSSKSSLLAACSCTLTFENTYQRYSPRTRTSTGSGIIYIPRPKWCSLLAKTARAMSRDGSECASPPSPNTPCVRPSNASALHLRPYAILLDVNRFCGKFELHR